MTQSNQARCSARSSNPGEPTSPAESPNRRSFLLGVGSGIAASLVPWRSGHAGPPEREGSAGRQARGGVDWRKVAAQFSFAPGLTYLNSGSEGSLPRRLQEQFSAALKRWSASPSFAFFSDPELDQAQKINRARLADFVRAPAGDVVITDNTTMGLAMVLMGLTFSRGDEVLTTEHEHYALLSPLNVLAQRQGVSIKKIPLPSPAPSVDALVEGFRRAISPRTRALCFSHVNWTTGLQMPIAEICALARSKGILSVVDGAHGLGMIDLDLRAWGCDFYACPGHKWFNGPPATGLLYIRDARSNPWRLVPVISEGSLLLSDTLTVADALQMRGSTNGPAFVTLARTADFADAIGKRVIEERIGRLADEVKGKAVTRWGQGCLFSPHLDADKRLRSGLSAFVPSADPSAAYDAAFVSRVADRLLTKHRIWVRTTMFPAPAGSPGPQINTLRVSTNIFNGGDDIDRLFRAIDEATAT